MTGPFEDDGLAHFAQVDQWDPGFEFYFVANQVPPHGDDDEGFLYEGIQQTSSPPLSPVPVLPAPPTPSSYDTFTDTTEDVYDNISSVSDEAASEVPPTELSHRTCEATSPVMSFTEEEQAPTTGHKPEIQWPTSHGKASMGVRSSRITSNAFRCRWERCEYSGGFSGIAALLRHIKTKHICPGLFECPEEHCSRSFNRKDNLVAHMRNVHREVISPSV